jgi:hypothetical protein
VVELSDIHGELVDSGHCAYSSRRIHTDVQVMVTRFLLVVQTVICVSHFEDHSEWLSAECHPALNKTILLSKLSGRPNYI